MTNLKAQLSKLRKNLNVLREREAKYAGNVPLELLNDIEDHNTAIDLFKEAIRGTITEAELNESLAPLNLALGRGQGIVAGDITGSIVAMGKGAQVIINKAATALEQAQEQEAYEVSTLASSIARIAQNLQNLVSPFMPIDGFTEIDTHKSSSYTNRNSLIINGKLAGSPYKALLDYKISDAPLFYGRRAAIKELLEHLKPSTLTILHAESGAGKTSLLQAGLASRLLTRGHLPLHIRAWNQDPSTAIKRAFIPDLNKTPGFARSPLSSFLHQVCSILGQEAHLYIFLDQFEEFFTQLNTEQQKHFITELGDVLDDEGLRVIWLLALRDEYFGQIATFSPRIRHPFERQYLLKSLNYEEAKEVIIQPAKQANVGYEKSLIPQILIDLTPEEGRLSAPELQLVCSALYENKKPKQLILTKQLYEDLGGAVGILGDHLNQVLEQKLPTEQRHLADKILMALINSDHQRVLRSLSELITATKSTEEALTPVLESLLENRLIRTSYDGTSSTEWVYELAHDYLLHKIEITPEAQALKAAQELLTRETKTYKLYGSLLTGAKLDMVLSQRDLLTMSEEERSYLDLSKKIHNRKRRNGILIGVAIFIVMLALTIGAFVEGFRARKAERTAMARTLASEALHYTQSDSEFGLLLALQAVAEDPSTPVKDTLRRLLIQIRPWHTLGEQEGKILTMAWTPNQHQIALGLENGEIQLWDVNSKKIITRLTGHTQAVRHLAFNAEGTRLASASASLSALDFFFYDDGGQGEVKIWDAKSGQQVGELNGHQKGVFSVAWAGDNITLATASADGTIKLWNTETMMETATLTGHTGKVRWVAWNSVQNKLASAGQNGEVFIWNLETQSQEMSLEGHQDDVFGLDWHPTAATLATAGADGTVRVWDTSNGQVMDILPNHQSFVRSVHWHPDGIRLVSASFGANKIIVWDTETGQADVTLTGHTDWIRYVVWDDTGNYLASASDDGTSRLWEVNVIPSMTVLAKHNEDVNHVAWHPNGKILASASRDTHIYLWHVENEQPLARLSGHTNNVWSVTWRPDGTQLASSGEDNTVRLWSFPLIDVDKPTTMLSITESAISLTGHTEIVFDTAWSTDGTLLASASADKSIKLWQTQNNTELKTLIGHTDSVQEVEFNADNSQLVSASADKTIKVWDVASGLVITTLSGHSSFVWDVEFSPDSTYITSASGDTTARVWDLTTGNVVAIFEHSQPVASATWSHDGLFIATASDDGLVRVWSISSPSYPVSTLTGHTGGVWSVAWSLDDTQIASGGADDVVHIFYTDFNQILNIAEQYKTRDLTTLELEQFAGQ